MSQIIQKSDGSQESRLIEIYGAMSAAWSQEGRYIILVTQQGQLGVYDITTQEPFGFPLSLSTFVRATTTRGFRPQPQPIEYRQPVNNTVQNTVIESAVNSPSGNYVAVRSVSDKREMQVWEVPKGQTGIFIPQVIRTYSGSPAPSGEVIWSPDEKFLVFASSNHIYAWAWEPVSGKTTLMYDGHGQDVGRIAWSPMGKYLASVSGSSIHVWEAATGRTHLIYKGHFQDVTSIAWSPDGTRIASGSHDETVQVWLAAEG